MLFAFMLLLDLHLHVDQDIPFKGGFKSNGLASNFFGDVLFLFANFVLALNQPTMFFVFEHGKLH